MGLIRDLGAGPVALDTAVFIYFMEEHPRFLPVVEPVFRKVDGGKLPAVTSALTLLEVLVAPFRNGDEALARRYEAILTRGQGLLMVDLTPAVLRESARIRAVTGVRTPDAIQLAAALLSGARSFLTNDRKLPDLPGLAVLQLSDYP